MSWCYIHACPNFECSTSHLPQTKDKYISGTTTSLPRDNNMVTLKYPEEERVYNYLNGGSLQFQDVLRVKVSESGNHRLETADGWKHIVAPGWISLSIKTKEWTF